MTVRPTVLCLSGHDPSGGAGIQADIETLAALGCHAASIMTAATVQDSRNVAEVVATDPALLRRQIAVLLDDIRPAAVKIGLIGSLAQLPALQEAISRASVPVVLDPVLRAGGGAELVEPGFPAALQVALLPQVTVTTPNAAEARRLAGQQDLHACGEALLATGAAHVLITGGDEPGPRVVNRWYHRGSAAREFVWPRLPGAFHGAGCTLASAIAAKLAQGLEVEAALAEAQAWTHGALERGFAPGRGRRIPGRAG